MKRCYLLLLMCVSFSFMSHAVETYTKTLQVGKSFTIPPYRPANTTPNVYHYYANDYKISNSSIVYVSKESAGSEVIRNGTLTLYFYKYSFNVFGQQPGETIIDVGYNNSGNLEVYMRYKVKVVDVKSISIPPSISLSIGQQYTFSPTITDAEATTTLTWKSSNEAVATITSEGVLTASAAGSTEVTCTAHNGVSASCVVTVNPVLATGVSLNQSSCELQQGETVKLVATVAPDNATDKGVTWESSDETVAEVASDGTVTGLKSGSCKITATTVDGSNKSASCVVMVRTNQILATGISLNTTSAEIGKGETLQLTATVSPSDATNKSVAWSSSSPDIAYVSGTGLVTAVKPGTCSIVATTLDGSSLSAACQVSVPREAEPEIKQGMVVWRKEQFDVYDVNEVDCVSFVNFETSDTREYVDLGLPSGTLWATCNIGASKPEEYGDYFAWGETTGYNGGKTFFNWSTYIYCKGSAKTMTKYCTQSNNGYNGFTDNLTKLHPSDDAATINWGISWCMPTHAQQMELKEKCTCQWTQRNGVNGLLVTGPNGHQIFLPAAGYRHDSSLINAGSAGVYWSRSLDAGTNYGAYNEHFTNASNAFPSYGRSDGFCVRPVRKQ